MNWLRTLRSEVQNSVKKKNTRWFFPSVLALVDRVTSYLFLVRGDKYLVILVEMHKSWPGHHGHLKKMRNFFGPSQCTKFFLLFISLNVDTTFKKFLAHHCPRGLEDQQILLHMKRNQRILLYMSVFTTRMEHMYFQRHDQAIICLVHEHKYFLVIKNLTNVLCSTWQLTCKSFTIL